MLPKELMSSTSQAQHRVGLSQHCSASSADDKFHVDVMDDLLFAVFR